MALRNGVDIDWKYVRCQPASLYEFINDISTFEPPASSIHLSDLHATSSHSDSFEALPVADSYATMPDDDSTATPPDADSNAVLPDVDSTIMPPDADSTAMSPDANSITMPSDSDDSSMPSFGSTDFGIDGDPLPSFHLPNYSSEESFDNNLPQGAIVHDPPQLEYFTIPDASICGRAKLADSQDYSFTVKRTARTAIHWRCSQCNPKSIDCKGTVHQEGIIFMKGCHDHLCQA